MSDQSKRRVGLLGPFGFGNLGDAAIQDAVIQNIRTLYPQAEIHGFSLNPEDTTQRHGIPAIPIIRSPDKPGNWLSRVPYRVRYSLPFRVFERFFVRIPAELALMFKADQRIRSLDLLIVSGGGQLDDYWGGAWGHPFVLLKFAAIAWLRRVKLVFLSVGAGPINSSLSRRFIKQALSLAAYRSYRDQKSKDLIQKIGFQNNDPVYPDLAYSLPVKKSERPSPDTASSPAIGISPMAYFDPRVWPEKDQAVYHSYLCKQADFIIQLLERNYTIMLFTNQIHDDRRAVDDLKDILKDKMNGTLDGRILDPMIESVEDLLKALASMDVVVATRLHSVILSQLLYKPVLALSYHPKIDVLMDNMGQSQYCLNVKEFQVDVLLECFESLLTNRETISEQIKKQVLAYQDLLDRQYKEVLQ